MSSIDHIKISSDITLHELDEHLLLEAKNLTQGCYIDLSDASYITAPGSVILLLYLQYLKDQGKDITVIPPRKEQTLQFLSNIRFLTEIQKICELKLLNFPKPVDRQQLSKWYILEVINIYPRMTETAYREWFSQSTANTIIDKISKLNSSSFEDLSTVYLELVDNVFEHSKSSGYISAQKIDRKLRLCIGDLGIGIEKSLIPFYEKAVAIGKFDRKYGPIWDEPKALDIAFIPGVSGKRFADNGEEEERGIGLRRVLTIAQEAKGAVICRSGTTKIFLGYKQGKWLTERRCNLDHFPGTQLEVYI